jgi:hypothetical protein
MRAASLALVLAAAASLAGPRDGERSSAAPPEAPQAVIHPEDWVE